ncbi:hypothetical protein D9M70_620870 [compost metagenome]
MVHMHVGENHVGHRSEVDARGLQPPDQLTRPRRVQVRIQAKPGVDEYGLGAASYHDHVQRPVESIRWQEHAVEPSCPIGRVGIVSQHRGWQWQHPIADHQHLDVTDPHRVTRWNQFFRHRPTTA